MRIRKGHRNTPGKNTLKYRLTSIITHFEEYSPVKVALGISSLYVAIGLVWILISDKILYAITSDDGLLSTLSIIKGLVYVFATGILLYTLILKYLNKIHSMNQTLFKNYREITAKDRELKEKIRRLIESEERYRLVSEATNDGIWDERQGKRFFSRRWYEMTGYTKEDIHKLGNWMHLIHPKDIKKMQERLRLNIKNRDPYYSCEYRMRFKDGKYRWILSKAKMKFDDEGKIIRSAGSHTDITQLKVSQDRLKKLAYRDFLTGIPNRISFYDTIRRDINNRPHKKKALIFFDIDNFKDINDTAGHLMGDQLLKGVGQRLFRLMNRNRTVYRISGDEFIILMHEYNNIEEVRIFTEELLNIIESPYNFRDYTFNITISTGIALYPLHGRSVDSLFKCADMAMYKSKSRDSGSYTFYYENNE